MSKSHKPEKEKILFVWAENGFSGGKKLWAFVKKEWTLVEKGQTLVRIEGKNGGTSKNWPEKSWGWTEKLKLRQERE